MAEKGEESRVKGREGMREGREGEGNQRRRIKNKEQGKEKR